MKNTGVSYRSTEKTPFVLPEFSELLPPLTEEQLAALENDLRTNGCYSPIIVNEDLVIVDGHNRQRLCEKIGIPYQIVVFAFEDALEAKQWALDTQKNRRNLDKWELGKIALKLKPEIQAKAQANMSAGGGDQKSDEAKSGCTTWSNPISENIDTRQELADSVGIGRTTMNKVIQIDEHAPDVVKEALDNKELTVNQGYNITKQVQELPEEDREKAAEEAVEMEKAKKDLRKRDAEADQRGKVTKQFCKAFEHSYQMKDTEENVRIWAECVRMTNSEMEEQIRESRELSERYSHIAELLKKILGERTA